MKKIIVLLMMISVSSVAVRADETSSTILAYISKTLSGYGNYEVRFTAKTKGFAASGTYRASGNKYRIKVQEQEHFSDGINRYEIYDKDKEIVIDEVDTSSHNILNNPTRAFEFADDEFVSTYAGQQQWGRIAVETVRLVPRTGRYGEMSVTLYVDATSGLPAGLEYDSRGDKLTITIDKITPLDNIPSSTFMFDPSAYADYEIIDFR